VTLNPTNQEKGIVSDSTMIWFFGSIDRPKCAAMLLCELSGPSSI